MDKKPLIVKCLAIGIILLFVGVTISPTINFNTVKASNDDDLVEITTQACGITGYKDTTVKLTREQYQNLEQYLVEFRAQLNQTSTREEAIPIFKDAVVELDKYGLLPQGMGIERAQKLVVGGFQNQRINKILEKFIQKYDKSVSDNRNFCCLIYGKNTPPFCIQRLLSHLICNLQIIFAFLISPPLFLFINDLMIVLAIVNMVNNPIHLGIMFFMGDGDPDYEHFIPSEGFINSYGLLGVKKYNGSFYGAIPMFPLILWILTDAIYSFPAVIGFTGIIIDDYNHSFNFTYLGSALWMDISSEPPENTPWVL